MNRSSTQSALIRTWRNGILLSVCSLVAVPVVAQEAQFAQIQQLKTQLERVDAEFVRSQQELVETLDGAVNHLPVETDNFDFDSERRALTRMLEDIESLISRCDSVLASQSKYLAAGRTYLADLAKASPAFQVAAKELRQFADEAQFDDHRQDYVTMAEICELMAARCAHRPPKLVSQVRAVEELFLYLQDGRQALVRFRNILRSIPVLQSGAKFDALDAKLQNYARSHQRFRDSLRKLRERLKATPAAQATDQTAHILRPDSREPVASHRSPPEATTVRVPRKVSAMDQRRSQGSPAADRVADERTTIRHLVMYSTPRSGNDTIRREVVGRDIEVGDVFSLGGPEEPLAIRIAHPMRSLSRTNVRVWWAELTDEPPTESATLLAVR